MLGTPWHCEKQSSKSEKKIFNDLKGLQPKRRKHPRTIKKINLQL